MLGGTELRWSEWWNQWRQMVVELVQQLKLCLRLKLMQRMGGLGHRRLGGRH